jgi:hypothetical protein
MHFAIAVVAEKVKPLSDAIKRFNYFITKEPDFLIVSFT